MKTAVTLTLFAGIAAFAGADAFAQKAERDRAKAAKPAAAATAAAVAAPVGPRVPAIGPVSTKRGEQVFVEYCAVCHGLYGKGDGPRYAFFAEDQYIPDLTIADFVQGRDRELMDGIRNGLRRLDEPMIVMPQFKYILSDNEMQSVLAFVKTLHAHPKNKK